MKRNAGKHCMKRITAVTLTAVMTLGLTACVFSPDTNENLVSNDTKEKKYVNLFGPMEKSKPNVTNAARSAFDLTVAMAEENGAWSMNTPWAWADVLALSISVRRSVSGCQEPLLMGHSRS